MHILYFEVKIIANATFCNTAIKNRKKNRIESKGGWLNEGVSERNPENNIQT